LIIRQNRTNVKGKSNKNAKILLWKIEKGNLRLFLIDPRTKLASREAASRKPKPSTDKDELSSFSP